MREVKIISLNATIEFHLSIKLDLYFRRPRTEAKTINELPVRIRSTYSGASFEREFGYNNFEILINQPQLNFFKFKQVPRIQDARMDNRISQRNSIPMSTRNFLTQCFCAWKMKRKIKI